MYPADNNPVPPPAQLQVAAPYDGFPLGEPILYLRYVPDALDQDIRCVVENVYGQPLATMQPMERVGWAQRGLGYQRFVLVGTQGAPILYLTGDRAAQVRVHVQDPAGGDLGRLVQARSAGWVPTSYPVTLEHHGTPMGSTTIGNFAGAMAHLDAPVYDTAGAVVATVDREWRYRSGGFRSDARYFDYKLDCLRPLSGTTPMLLLATLLCHYIFDRAKIGGPVNFLQRKTTP